MRRQFELLDEDQGFLENLGLPWETIVEGRMLWLMVHDYYIPEGYSQDKISLAINISNGYPRTQLDMVYFLPAISRIDGKPIGALAQMIIEGVIWQRWSRHRTPKNPWREGVDNLATHFALIDYWLEREFILKPYAVPV